MYRISLAIGVCDSENYDSKLTTLTKIYRCGNYFVSHKIKIRSNNKFNTKNKKKLKNPHMTSVNFTEHNNRVSKVK